MKFQMQNAWLLAFIQIQGVAGFGTATRSFAAEAAPPRLLLINPTCHLTATQPLYHRPQTEHTQGFP